MVNIQSPTAEIRRGKKERRRRRKKKKKEEEERRRRKKQDENIMVCPITYGDHNQSTPVCCWLRPDGSRQCKGNVIPTA